MLDILKLGFIDGGNMAAALIGGLIAKGVHGANIVVVDPTEPARSCVKQTWDARTAAVPGAEPVDRDVIALAAKPQQTCEVYAQLASYLRDSLALSVVAGIRIQSLSRWPNDYVRVVRVMPDTPALSGLGMTGLAINAGLSDDDRATASAIVNVVGKSVWTPAEAQIDAVTAILGSGPVYVFYLIGTMQQAAQEPGLSVEDGRMLTVKMFIGTATLVGQPTEPVEVLCERTTSKGGTTYAALMSMEGADIKATFVRAIHVVAA